MNGGSTEYARGAWITPLGVIEAWWGPDGVRNLRLPTRPPDSAPVPGPVLRKGDCIFNGADNADAVKTGEELENFLSAFFSRQPAQAPFLDESAGTAFERLIWRQTREIQWGSTIGYGELASLVGSAGAARAAGRALGKNPLPLLTPCHRVVLAGYVSPEVNAGGFSCGTGIKRWLLSFEHNFPN